MSDTISSLFIFLVIVVSLFLQTTLLSPYNLGAFSPDLNLILIIFIALYAKRKLNLGLAIFSGYLMDILSGVPVGVHLLSRASLLILLSAFKDNIYPKRGLTQFLALFFATLYTWSFVYLTFIITDRVENFIPFSRVYIQGFMNSVTGVVIFGLLKRTNARL